MGARAATQQRQTTADLDRPQLRPGLPVLRRSDAQLQIGLSAAFGLVINAVDPGTEQLLELFDGRHDRSELRAVAEHHGLDVRIVDQLIAVLGEAGLLASRSRPPGAVRSPRRPEAPTGIRGSVIRLIGAGPLGRAVGLRLFEARPAGIVVSDPADADRHLYPQAQLADSRADALVRLLRDQVDPADQSIRIDSGPAWHALDADPALARGQLPAITVVTTDTAEVDRAVTDLLLRRDELHLVVTLRPDATLVGPLVVPGQTACLNCLDLARRRFDPAWPQLLGQLVRLPTAPRPLSVSWAATMAVVQVESWLATGSAETVGGTLELSDADRQMLKRDWQIQPGCGCAWPRTARWEA